jgi:hypothetical protein
MAVDHQVYSNFFSRNDLIKHVALVQGKNLLIDAIRGLFINDSVFPYRFDIWGFPLIVDHTNLPLEEAGTQLDTDGNPINLTQLSTKILITSTYRQDVNFYPVITVKQTSIKEYPISFNQNAIQVHYRKEFIRDGYGNQKEIRTPTHYIFADGWNQSFEIKIVAEDIVDRDHLADIVVAGLWGIKRAELRDSGLLIQNISGGGEQEEESLKHVSKLLYTYTITVNTFSEWSREIPIRSIIERINFYFDIASTGVRPSGEIDILDNDMPNSANLIAVLT